MITYTLNFAPTFFCTDSCMRYASIFIRTLTTQTLPHEPTALTSIVILLVAAGKFDFCQLWQEPITFARQAAMRSFKMRKLV